MLKLLCILAFFSFDNLFAYKKPSILIIYNVPQKIPNKNWNDGFVAAMTLLEKKYDVAWITLSKIESVDFNRFDIIFVKSSWSTECEKTVRQLVPSTKRKALLISNTNEPSSLEYALYYDVLFYETQWYKKFIIKHPYIIQAFGINTNIFHPSTEYVEKKYDYIMVADFNYASKRHLKFLEKSGNKLALGSVNTPKDNLSKEKLIQAGVEVRDFVPPEELAKLYHQSHICYLPCSIHGGGDRSVLEARSCGTKVEIEPDNQKLKELLEGPILDHYFYAQQLEKGIEILLQK